MFILDIDLGWEVVSIARLSFYIFEKHGMKAIL